MMKGNMRDITTGRGEPEHDHCDGRYRACTDDPDAIVLDGAESNEPKDWIIERLAP